MCRLLLLALLLASPAGRAAYPDVTATRPNGAQRGSVQKVTLTGARLADFEDLMFFSPGFQVKSVESRAEGKVELTLAVDASVPPGNHLVRVRTKSGLSHPRQFFVSPYPNVEEREPNSDFGGAQAIGLNCTVEGVVLAEDVDYFRLSVKKGQRISVEVEGLRLGYGLFDPYVAILDRDRFEKAFSDDTILHRQDGHCSFTAEYDGDYYVMVREASYRGSPTSFYRLHVGEFRRPDVVYPAGGKLGSRLTVRFVDGGEGSSEEVALPGEEDPEFMLYPKSQSPSPSGNPFRLSAFDNTLEAEPNDAPEQGTVAAEAPAYALNGVIGRPGDVDCFRVPLKKGQNFDVRAYAQSVGSPLDPVVAVLDPKGRNVISNDDGGGMRRLDSRFRFTAAVDGVHTFRIGDHLDRGGPAFVYRVEAVAARPSLTFASPEYIINDTHYRQFLAVPRGGRMVLMENLTRNGVGGDYRFELAGLPAGVRVLSGPLSGDLPGAPLVLEASADAPLAGKAVPVRLLPVDAKSSVVGQLRQVYDIVRQGNTVYYQGVEDKLPVAVVEEAPYSLQILPAPAPLVRDGTQDLRVVAKRKDGFKAPIRVFICGTPPGVSALGEQTIPAEAAECSFQLSADANVAPRSWRLVVQGEADAGQGRVYNASPFAEVVTEPAYVAAPAIPLTAFEVGRAGVLTTSFEVLRPFAGEAVATLVGLTDVLSAAPLKVTKDTKELRFTVTADAKAQPGKRDNLFVQVDVPTGKGVASHRVALGSALRLDAPRKPAAAPAPPGN